VASGVCPPTFREDGAMRSRLRVVMTCCSLLRRVDTVSTSR
jgi:hypothetical protein